MLLPQRLPKTSTVGTFARHLMLDHVWIITGLVLVWLFISVLPLPPNDLWWHMAAGRAMVAEGGLIHTNRWAYTLPADAPYVWQSWLSELVLYGLWRIGDVPLLALGRMLVVTSSYGLLAWQAWRRCGHGKAVVGALLLAVLIGWNNWTLRPQTLALLPAALFVVVMGEVLAERASRRALAALPLLMLIWVNMHGSFILGVGLLGLAWLSVFMTNLRHQRRRAADWPAVRGWSVATGATVVALLLNPLGSGIFGYVGSIFGHKVVQTRITEWQPLRNSFNLTDTGFWFFATLLLLAGLMALSPRRPKPVDLLWYCGLAWMGISASRHAIWFGLFLMPLVAEQLAALSGKRRQIRGNSTLNTTYLGLCGLVIFAMLPWFMPARYLGPNPEKLFATTGPYRLLLSRTTPLAATQWLAEHPITGRFWTDITYASYTEWQLPDKQIFADLRIELFPDAIWDDYFAITEGDADSLALLDRWQISHLLLDKSAQADLHTLLRSTVGWCEQYADDDAVIIARCS